MPPSDPQTETLILGAGPCGLALAWELGQRGGAALLVDRNPEVGGLARTFRCGPYRSDLSIHRLQVQDPRLKQRLEQLFAGQLHLVKRKTIHVQLGRRRVPYPIGVRSLVRLPWVRAGRASMQFLQRSLATPSQPEVRTEASYRQWFEARFGPELYRWIAGPLVEKQWGLPGDQLSDAFGAHRRLTLGPRDLLTQLPGVSRLVQRSIPASFVYGTQGVGPLMDTVARQVTALGGRALLGCEPVRVIHRRSRVQAVQLSDGQTVACQQLASSIPLPALVALMDPPPPAPLLALARQLRFRELVVVALVLDRQRVSRDHTTYFPEARFPFSRTFEVKNAAPQLVPRGKTVLGFELPCFAGDDLWRMPDDELVQWMSAFGDPVGFAPGEVEQGFVIRVPEAYPLYSMGYQQVASRVLRWLHGELSNLFCVGRNGLFRLDNMDHAFTMGFDLARHLAGHGSSRQWHHGLGRYHKLSYID